MTWHRQCRVCLQRCVSLLGHAGRTEAKASIDAVPTPACVTAFMVHMVSSGRPCAVVRPIATLVRPLITRRLVGLILYPTARRRRDEGLEGSAITT